MFCYIEEIFQPAIPPPHYKSKLATGMVGIENQGATCYLNSMLQVNYYDYYY
jgi:ubiquitin C-terminal hydrolase